MASDFSFISILWQGNLASFDNRNNGPEANNRFSSPRSYTRSFKAFCRKINNFMKKLPFVSGAMLVFTRFCVDVCQKSDNRYCQHLSSPTTHDYKMSPVLQLIFQLFGFENVFSQIYTHSKHVRCSCFSDRFEIFYYLLKELRKQEVFTCSLLCKQKRQIYNVPAIATNALVASNGTNAMVASLLPKRNIQQLALHAAHISANLFSISSRSIFVLAASSRLVQEYFAHLKRSLLNRNLALNLGRSSCL